MATTVCRDPSPTAPAADGPIVDFVLDASDTIVQVGGAWDVFATANDGKSLIGNSVIGRPLREYISGDVTRMFVEVMIKKVRVTGRSQTVPYRCDSPGIKRFMQMELIPQDKELLCRHQVLREERMAPPVRFVHVPGRLDQVVKRCSMCNRLARRNGQLVEPDALQARELFSPNTDGVYVIYYVCGDCQTRLHDSRL